MDNLLLRRRMMTKSEIPGIYRRINYVESENVNSYADISVLGNIITPFTHIEVKARIGVSLVSSSRQFFFSIGNSSVSHYVECDVDGSLSLGSGSVGQFVNVTPNIVYDVDYDIFPTESVLKVNGSEVRTTEFQSSSNIYPMNLFRVEIASFSGERCRIYSFDMNVDGNQYCSLIPCEMMTDNVFGFFDLVTKTFIASATNYPFIGG